MDGFVKLRRGVLDSEIWNASNAVRVLFLHLLMTVDHRSACREVSVRRLSIELGWAIGPTHRTLSALETLGVIGRDALRRPGRICVLKYHSGVSYREQEGPNDVPNREQSVPHRERNVPHREHAPYIEEKKLRTPKRRSAPRALPAALLEELYSLYPRKQGRAKGLAKAREVVRSKEVYHLVLVAIQRMAEAWSKVPKSDLRYCPHFSTFMNQRRWEDEQLPLPQTPSPSGPAPRKLEVLA